MYKKLILNDIKSSKLITGTILLFILFTTFLLSTSGIILANLSSSIDHLMEKSQTPHYLQMHMGEFDAARMKDFAEKNANVSNYQVQKFLNVDSGEIFINGESFGNSSQDNGFVAQNNKFDYLLDLQEKVVYPKEGEVFIPLDYFLKGDIAEGDKLTVNNTDFRVAGPIRDSQMNSTLSSSKRFLIHEEDYEKISSIGTEEYLIEFLLYDVERIGEFEGDYHRAGLESNGPTITHRLFAMINGISDGILVVILFLISLLVLLISFLCIRFTMTAKIEEEYREIGVLKAIGIRNSEIKNIYKAKYLTIAALGGVSGYLISVICSDYFLKPIRLAMGEGKGSGFGMILGFFLSVLIFGSIALYLNHILNIFKKITPAKALKKEVSEGKSARFKLRNRKILNSNGFLGMHNVISGKKLYATFAIVLILSAFIMVLPKNIYSTVSSRSFVNYMGIGDSDMLITIQERGKMAETSKMLEETLGSDVDVEKFSMIRGKKYEMKLTDGSMGTLQVALGDQSGFLPAYTKGAFPKGEDEISISYLNAEELGKDVGDNITLIKNGKEKDLRITGIYSDITNGGKTAHANFTDNEGKALWTMVPVSFKAGADIRGKAKQYEGSMAGIKAIGISDYMDQVFGSTIKSIGRAADIGLILAISLSFLITLLFVNMLVSKDRRKISILKTIGFSSKKIEQQYQIGSVFLVMMGVVLGAIFAATLGQVFASRLMSVFGAANIKFALDYLFVFVITPITLAVVVMTATAMGVKSIQQMKISKYIKE